MKEMNMGVVSGKILEKATVTTNEKGMKKATFKFGFSRNTSEGVVEQVVRATCFGKVAEYIETLEPGKMVCLEQIRFKKNKDTTQDGVTIYSNEFIFGKCNTKVNEWAFAGRLTKDPEIRTLNNEKQTKTATFTLAVGNGKVQDQEITDYIQCKCFGKEAENIEKWVKKGQRIVIWNGEFTISKYTNKEGKQVEYTEVVFRDWVFGEKKEEKPQNNDNTMEGFENIPSGVEEDLPFN